LRRASGVEDHFTQLFDSMTGDGGDGVIRSRMDGDDIAVAEVDITYIWTREVWL